VRGSWQISLTSFAESDEGSRIRLDRSGQKRRGASTDWETPRRENRTLPRTEGQEEKDEDMAPDPPRPNKGPHSGL